MNSNPYYSQSDSEEDSLKCVNLTLTWAPVWGPMGGPIARNIVAVRNIGGWIWLLFISL